MATMMRITSTFLLLILLSMQSAFCVSPPDTSPSASPHSAPPESQHSSPPSPSPSPPAPTPSDPSPAPTPLPATSPSDPPPQPSPAPAPAPTNSTDVKEIVTGGKSPNSSSGGMSSGKKAGVAFGVIAAVAVVGIGGFVYKKRQDNIRRTQYGNAARSQFL